MKNRPVSFLATIASSLLVVFTALSAFGLPAYQSQVTASGYAGSTTLTDFPVLVRISPSAINGFAYADCAANGADISFVLADGTVLPHEIDTWNTSGESLVWVKVPALTGTSTSFLFRWSDATPPSNASTSVWDADYIGVWHMGEISPAGAVPDATGNGYNAATSSVAVVSTDTSKVGAAVKVVSGRLNVANYESEFTTAGTVFSGSGWFILPGRSASYMSIVNKKTTNGDAWNSTSGWYWEMNNSLTVIGFIGKSNNKQTVNIPNVTANWNHFTFTSSGSQIKLYINGSLSKTYSHALTAGGKLMALMPVAGGVADEFRMRNAVSSADWVRAEYDTVSNAGFLTYGDAQEAPADFAFVSANGTQYGTVSPAYGTVTDLVDGQSYTFSCTTPTVPVGTAGTTRIACAGWKLYSASDGTLLRSSDDANESATTFSHSYAAGNPIQVVWQWKTQYLVTATANAGGTVSPASQWVDANGTASVTATPDDSHGFHKWTNDVPASVSATSPTISFPVTAPLSLFASFGNVLYVSPDGNDANDGATAATALATIETAMSSAVNGVTIYLLAGEHELSQTLALTNEVSVIGAGRDTTTIKAPANGAFTAIKVANANASLKGITLTGVNFTTQPSAASSGGTYDASGNFKACMGLLVAAGTVAHCAVSNNTCNLRTPKGFVMMSGGTLDDVIVSKNTVNRGYGYASGFGVYMSGGTMTNCVVFANSASGQQQGAVFMSGSAKIVDSEVVGNRGSSGDHSGIYATASGNVIDHCRIHANVHNGVRLIGTMRDSLIYCNTNTGTAYAGVLMDNASAWMYNCTIWGNVTKGATDGRSGLQQSAGTAINNIIWGNGPDGSTFGSTLVSGGTFRTNIVDVATTIGTGVLVADPKFKNAAGLDFSLTLASPAVNAGAPLSSITTDFDWKARDASIDIGAYEFTASDILDCAIVLSQTTYASGASPTAKAAVSGAASPSYAWYVDGTLTDQTSANATFPGLGIGYHTLKLVVTDGGSSVQDEVENAILLLPTETYVSTTGSNTFPYDTEAKAALSVNDAFNATWSDSSTAGTVHIGAGTFTLSDTLLMKTPYRILGAGRDATIISGGGTATAARALNIGNAGVVVRDLTITGCTNTLGGTAIYMSAGWLENVRSTRNRQNSTGGALGGGAGLYLADGTVTNCMIDANNGAATYGNTPSVGLRMTGGLVVDSVICSNTMWRTQQQGVGVNMSGGTIRRCQVFQNKSTSNSTESRGHGIYMTGGTVEFCNIYSNGYNGVYMTAGTLRNCAIYGHKASHNIFPGVYKSGGTMQNCTIYGKPWMPAVATVHWLP